MGLSDILKGAGGGALAGSALGPWGAVGGGLLGGLAGAFGSSDTQDQQNQLSEYQRQIAARNAPQIANTALAGTSDFRGNQADLIRRLEAQAAGQGPSLAGETLKAATDRNIAQQAGAAQSGRGNATLANIVAANNIGNLGAQASQQAALARIAEQQSAQQMLGSNINAGRAQDENMSQFNAQQQNYTAKDNLEAKLRAMGLNDTAIANVLNNQTQLLGRPTLGDQILAGGAGAAGLFASQNAGANAARANRPASYSPNMINTLSN